MNVGSTVLWGFVATLVLTTIMAASQGLGISRMSIPFMLGTMFTSNRNSASLIGFIAHSVVGWAFALIYAWAFEDWGYASWWLGGCIGLLHGLVILLTFMPMLPGLHPRMASEYQGPEPTRNLEPPGFLALNYGRRTPAVALTAHVVYGIILGSFYRLSGG